MLTDLSCIWSTDPGSPCSSWWDFIPATIKIFFFSPKAFFIRQKRNLLIFVSSTHYSWGCRQTQINRAARQANPSFPAVQVRDHGNSEWEWKDRDEIQRYLKNKVQWDLWLIRYIWKVQFLRGMDQGWLLIRKGSSMKGSSLWVSTTIVWLRREL